MGLTEQLSDALKKAVAVSGAPGAVGAVGDVEKVLFLGCTGYSQIIPERKPVQLDTLYDLASLTKVIATTTAVLLLKERGKISLDAYVTEYLPVPAFHGITIRHLLTHTSGLPGYLPLYKAADSVTGMIQQIASLKREVEPGQVWRYSDLGFLILGRVVELVSQERLDSFCSREIFTPLKMSDTFFNPPAEVRIRCAATERCEWRGKLIQGEVHDENAYAVGGIAGHSGLFSTVGDLVRFCQGLLQGKILSSTTISEMVSLGQVPFYPWQGLGWKLDPWASSSEGFLPSRKAFGHSGWTGTCVWIDPEKPLFVILLSNTCHPSRKNRENAALRQMFCKAIAHIFYTERSNVHVGLDRLLREQFEPIRGKRIAVLTHHAAVDQLGRHLLDLVKYSSDTKVEFIYSPEHGLRGQAEAGVPVPSEDGKIPIISLMGDRKMPSREELQKIDVFVVDLQDVGARYYTYVATMKDCLEVCFKAGKSVLILDRVNPLGGEILEGPLATREDSAVCWGRVPTRHGLTLGELGGWFAARHGEKAQKLLRVLMLDSWERKHFFDECALLWVAPSPNMVSLETAILYVGMCLFEGTNMNEGRGTDKPFQMVGAPWFDPDRVLALLRDSDMTGCFVSSVEYVPRSIPGKASKPKYLNEKCRGIHLEVVDKRLVRPFRVAVAILCAILKTHPDKFSWDTKEVFDLLAGTSLLREKIEEGEDPVHIVETLERQNAEFFGSVEKLYE